MENAGTQTTHWHRATRADTAGTDEAVAEAGPETTEPRRPALYWTQRGLQVLDALFCLLFALIGLQIGMEALGANDAAGFKRVMDTVTGPFLAPFGGLFNDPAAGIHEFKLSYLVAILIYALVHAGIRRVAAIALDVPRRVLDLPTRRRKPE